MKNFIFVFFTIVPILCFGQEQKDTNTYAFPIGSKFILELVQTGPNEYKYHVLDMKPIDFAIDYMKNDTLFESVPKPGTIECIFARGIDQSGPFKTVLAIRNNTKLFLQYKAEIAFDQSGRFTNTSVEPLMPGVKSSELWNNNLAAIVIHKISEYKRKDQ